MRLFDFAPLSAHFGARFHADEPLHRYTAARLGGPAAGLVRVESRDELAWACRWARDAAIPWFILGGGANTLIADAGYNGLVIINRAKESHLDESTGRVTADSGANLSTLGRQCMSAGLAGLEWSVSVPGTVGGAVVNNAGAHGGDMAGCLTSAEILDLESDEIESWPNERLDYDYRASSLKRNHGRYVVLDASLKLTPGYDPNALNIKADEFIAHRKQTQPAGASLGSMFKNPAGDYAGRLIESAGLKGQRAGHVLISDKHANFFVNDGQATAADYWTLIQLAQQTVKAQLGVALELEIELLGDWSTHA